MSILTLQALCAFAAGPASAQTWIGFTMGRAKGGVKVLKPLAGSPADKAGLKRGDVVTAVNGKRVASPKDILRIVSRRKVGSRITIQYRRGGTVRTGRAVLTRRPSLEKILKLLLSGERAPNFVLRTMSGGRFSLSSLRGKVVVLEFWATWCKSCKISLRKLSGLYRRRAKQGLAIVALARNTVAEARPEARRLGLPFTVVADPGAKVATRYRLSKVPSMVLLDRRGIIRDVVLGSSYKLSWLERRIVKLLKKRSP
jgi:peroxiredoxin